MLYYQELISKTNRKLCERFGISSYEFVVNADHIHIIIKFPRRVLYTRWIRSLTGVLARKIVGLKWEEVPYSRISNWGRDFEKLREYVLDNKAEADFIAAAHAEVERQRLEFLRMVAAG